MLNNAPFWVGHSRDGDAIIPIENKLVYTDFDKEDPGISKIIAFNTKNGSAIAAATDTIYDEEKGVLSSGESSRIIKEVFGEEFLWEYKAEMFGNDERYDRQAERGKSRSDAYHAEREQNRKRISVKDGENVRHSLADDSETDFETMYIQYKDAVSMLYDRV